jgi:hypothetical protein
MAAPVPYRCLVPHDAIGLLIGRGGSSVRQISKDSGAEINVSGDGDTPPSLSDRIVTLCGGREQKEAACRQVVQKLYQFQAVADDEPGIFVMLLPSMSAEFVIGTKGEKLRALIEESGADVVVEDDDISGTEERPVSFRGTLEQTAAAAARLGVLLQDFVDSAPVADCEYADSCEAVRTFTQGNSSASTSLPELDGAARVWGRGRISNTDAAPAHMAPSGSSSGSTAGPRPTARARWADEEDQEEEPLPGPTGNAEVPYRCLAPIDALGLINGHGDVAARQISQESGADVRVSGDHGDTPSALSDRIVDIRGSVRQKDDACRQIVQKLFQAQDVVAGESGIFVMLVPLESVAFMREFVLDTSSAIRAEVFVEEEAIEDMNEFPVRITGTCDHCAAAAAAIGALLQKLSDQDLLKLPPPPPAAIRSIPAQPIGRLSGMQLSLETQTLANGLSPVGMNGKSTVPQINPRRLSTSSAGSAPSTQRVHHKAKPPAADMPLRPTRLAPSGRTSTGSASSTQSSTRVWGPRAPASVGRPASDGRPASEMSEVRTRGEVDGDEKILKELSTDGGEAPQVELTLMLPEEDVRRALVSRGRLRALVARSGSEVRVGAIDASAAFKKAKPMQLVMIKGTKLTNSLAVLYLQELLTEHASS